MDPLDTFAATADALSLPLPRSVWMRLRATAVWPMQARWGHFPTPTILGTGQRVRLDGAWNGMVFVALDPEGERGGWVPASLVAQDAALV
jgi:hypothetical protein